MLDRFERNINYLRISVTDRCNLRCRYCMPDKGVTLIRHEDILTYDEITGFTRVAVDAGITKVRITGGEPLVRKGSLTWLPCSQELKVSAICL
ncbi:MAG: radical SAM protein [Marinilabiliales bacterium]|nr:radical SAM protein [Marinilabiliales bacterium]